jgi:hypothetical protein
MIFKRLSAKKWLLGITSAVAVYLVLWWLTEAWGVPQVRTVAVEAMRQPAPQRDGSEPGDDPMAGPIYQCSAGAYGPLVVRADYQWQNGAGAGKGSTLYAWIFGRTFPIREVRSEAL